MPDTNNGASRKAAANVPKRSLRPRRTWFGIFASAFFSVLCGASGALFATCGPFTDVAADAFCPFVLEIFTLGVTTGTTATTYDPASNVTRLQMAAFLSRSVDGVMKRGKRAALRQFWTTQGAVNLGLTTVGASPAFAESDGRDVWVTHGNAVSRVQGSDGKLLETWTGATNAEGVLAAMGKIFVAANQNPGVLYRIDPGQPPTVPFAIASLGAGPQGGIAFDGGRIWTANQGSGSISIVTPTSSVPWPSMTITAGFTGPAGMLYDGADIWVTDLPAGTLLKLDSSGSVLQTVTVGTVPLYPAFDGANIWVPNNISNSVTVARASNGAVLATLTGNGLSLPFQAAFDSQRILVTNLAGNSVSLWKAADLSPLGTFSTGASTGPGGACSDVTNFWIVLGGVNSLARF
jgi:hypothetical protein